jgi:hypothetical protein
LENQDSLFSQASGLNVIFPLRKREARFQITVIRVGREFILWDKLRGLCLIKEKVNYQGKCGCN